MKLVKIYLASCGHCVALWQALEWFSICPVEEIEVSDRIVQWEMIRKYELVDIPTLLFIDANWNVVWRLEWLITRSEIDKEMEKMLN